MEIKILEERPNPLLKRHEYRFEVAHATAATPSRDSVRGELSRIVKAPKDRVIIERMSARYGTATTRGDALVYDTADAAKSITRAHILVRNGLREKEAPGGTATPAAEPAKTPAVPNAESPKEEKPAVKSDSTAEAKAEHKTERKPEQKAEAKSEHPPSAKPESHKGEHKPKSPKAEKDVAPAKGE